MTNIPFRELLLAPLDLYLEAVMDGCPDRFIVPGYIRVGEGPFGYLPGVLEIHAELPAVFYDVATYERMRNETSAEGEPWTANIDVPPELLNWLVGVWAKIEEKELEKEAVDHDDPSPFEDVEESARRGCLEGIFSGLFGESLGRLLENLLRAIQGRDSPDFRAIQRANRTKRWVARQIVDFHRKLTGREPVRVSVAEWVEGRELMDSRFPEAS